MIFRFNYTFHLYQHLYKVKPNKFISILRSNCAVGRERKLFSINSVSENIKQTGARPIGIEKHFARQILENSPEYSETIITSKNFSELWDASDIFKKILDNNAANKNCKSDVEHINQSKECVEVVKPHFDTFSSIIIDRCNELNDTQISEILICLMKLPETEKLSSSNFKPLWQALDKECVTRSKNWNIKDLLLFADLWFVNNLLPICKYMYEVAWCLGKKLKHLSPKEFVQFMFYLNSHRQCKMLCTNYDIEYYFSKLIDQLTINEIAIVSMAFNKLKVHVQSEYVLNYIILNFKSDINSIDSIAVCAISKLLSYHIPYSLEEQVSSLLNEVCPNIPRFTTETCIHIAELGTKNRLLHEDSFNMICERFVSKIKEVRLKDIERMIQSLSIYNYQPQNLNICDKIVEELYNPDRDSEMEHHPKCLVRCLSNLVRRNIFCDDLINNVLHPDFILTVYGKNLFHLDTELLNLDVSVEVERPLYQGSRLTEKQRAFVAKSIPKRLPLHLEDHVIGYSNRITLEILITCRDLYGESNVYVGCLLPQFRYLDIVIGVKGTKEFVPIPECISKWKPGLLKRAVQMEDVVWYCLVIGFLDSFVRRTGTLSGDCTGNLAGGCVQKLRQLRLIGYHPIVIPNFDWTALKSTERKEYLTKKIFGENFNETEDTLLKNSI